MYATTAGIAANSPNAVAIRASAIPGATIARVACCTLPRLLKALNYPKIILPTHWDNFEKPFTDPAQDLRSVFGDPGNLDLWVKEARKVSPKSKVMVLKFFESWAP